MSCGRKGWKWLRPIERVEGGGSRKAGGFGDIEDKRFEIGSHKIWDYATRLNLTANPLRHINDDGPPYALGNVWGKRELGAERDLVTLITPG